MDGCARPTVGRRGRSTYVAFGIAGWLAGLALVLTIGHFSNVPITTRCVLAIVPAGSLLASLGLASRGWFSTRVVFYEKALIALGATGIALFAAGQPLRAGLDLALLGIGTFLAVGRLGCFCVACCHGKRARIGVRYGWRHTSAGYPKRWVGVRVFPIQLIDSLLSATAVALGSWVELSPHLPGSPLATYSCVYGIGRFFLEFWRGDAARRYVAGVSEAQGTAAVSSLAVALYCPLWWTILTAVLLVLGVALLVVTRRAGFWSHLWLTSGKHLAEMDSVLSNLVAGGPAQTTREGLRMQLTFIEGQRFRLTLGPSLGKRSVQVLSRQLGRAWTVVGVEPTAVLIESRVSPEALIDS